MVGDAERNALEHVARLERENAELRERIGRIRAGEPPRPAPSRAGRLALARLIILLVATGVSLRFAISATRAERSASELGSPAELSTCEGSQGR